MSTRINNKKNKTLRDAKFVPLALLAIRTPWIKLDELEVVVVACIIFRFIYVRVYCVCVCVYRLTEMPFFFCCFVFFRFFVLLSRSRRRTLFCFFEFARQKFDRSVPLQRRRIHSSHRKKKTKKKTKNWRQRIEEEESWVVPFSFRLQVSLFISL